jgi:hypothetical protein
MSGSRKDAKMNKNTLSLAAAALLISGGVTYAQQQKYDSLGCR